MSTRLPAPAFEGKICTMDELAERAAALAHPVVMTNGVFDILHRGHVTYLAQARSLGGSLVVAINSDASVKMLGKGDDRPIHTAAARAARRRKAARLGASKMEAPKSRRRNRKG